MFHKYHNSSRRTLVCLGEVEKFLPKETVHSGEYPNSVHNQQNISIMFWIDGGVIPKITQTYIIKNGFTKLSELRKL